MSESRDWADVIHKMFDERRQLAEEFDREWSHRKPNASFEEFDYWEAEDGIVRIRVFPSGKYDRHSLRHFSEQEMFAMMTAFFGGTDKK